METHRTHRTVIDTTFRQFSKNETTRPRGRWQCTLAILLVACVATLPGCWDDGPIPAEEEEEFDILIGSTQAGSGALAAHGNLHEPVSVELSAEIGDVRLYSSSDPGFASVGVPTEGLFPLPRGARVQLQIVSAEEGAQIRIGETVLAEAGDVGDLGVVPIHKHAEWQLVLPAAQEPEPRRIRFVLTTSAPGYSPSEVYTMVLQPRT